MGSYKSLIATNLRGKCKKREKKKKNLIMGLAHSQSPASPSSLAQPLTSGQLVPTAPMQVQPPFLVLQSLRWCWQWRCICPVRPRCVHRRSCTHRCLTIGSHLVNMYQRKWSHKKQFLGARQESGPHTPAPNPTCKLHPNCHYHEEGKSPGHSIPRYIPVIKCHKKSQDFL